MIMKCLSNYVSPRWLALTLTLGAILPLLLAACQPQPERKACLQGFAIEGIDANGEGFPVIFWLNAIADQELDCTPEPTNSETEEWAVGADAPEGNYSRIMEKVDQSEKYDKCEDQSGAEEGCFYVCNRATGERVQHCPDRPLRSAAGPLITVTIDPIIEDDMLQSINELFNAMVNVPDNRQRFEDALAEQGLAGSLNYFPDGTTPRF